MHGMRSENSKIVAIWGDNQLSNIVRNGRLNSLSKLALEGRKCLVTNSITLRMIFFILRIPPGFLQRILLPLLLVFPGLLQVDQIRPSNLLSNSYEELRSPLCNSSARPRLDMLLAVRLRKSRVAKIFRWSENAPASVRSAEPWRSVGRDLWHYETMKLTESSRKSRSTQAYSQSISYKFAASEVVVMRL